MKIIRPKCPECDSANVAWIQWGRRPIDDNFKEMLDDGRAILGGCFISENDARWECNSCGKRFGNSELPPVIYKRKYKKVPQYISAHIHSICNESELMNSQLCGCFNCISVFHPERISEWIDDIHEEKTALCPYCSVDSVIGDQSGYKITKEFLQQMHNYWNREKSHE